MDASNHRVAHNAVRAGQRYYASRRKGASRRMRRAWRGDRTVAAFEALVQAAQRMAEAVRRIVEGVAGLGRALTQMLAPLRDPSRPLIDRVRESMVLWPDATPSQVAYLVGEERVRLVTLVMLGVVLDVGRSRVAATPTTPPLPGTSTRPEDLPPASLRASRSDGDA
ncbi:hypothetical protein DAETH_28730 [Deinococcus aetherius]|uniref:Uncharacterized protein n=1 Tax=Deinococcus aetherius TaxID=200252 RepID=A0ABN6RJ72_9DEIO|nr:hypothetical protein [Deinococcus aetherius]BDP42904.1 hypothetical protein DAETH_28730 [Deinococcus aetherius]